MLGGRCSGNQGLRKIVLYNLGIDDGFTVVCVIRCAKDGANGRKL